MKLFEQICFTIGIIGVIYLSIMSYLARDSVMKKYWLATVLTVENTQFVMFVYGRYKADAEIQFKSFCATNKICYLPHNKVRLFGPFDVEKELVVWGK